MGLFSAAPKAPAYSHGDRLLVGGAPVILRVNPRAQRVSLRVDRRLRAVIATAPSARKLAEAVAFARQREGWIAEHLAGLAAPRPFEPGQVIAVFGRDIRLEQTTGRGRFIPAEGDTPARLLAGGEGAVWSAAVLRRIKALAGPELATRTARFCAMLDRPCPPVTVMDAKGRWGSCRPATASRPAAIRYCWRLALGPPDVADYVCAHEAAHLIEANHGPRFWALVARLHGDPAPHRAWLRAHGDQLHAMG